MIAARRRPRWSPTLPRRASGLSRSFHERLKTDPAEHLDPAQSDSLVELHRWLDARSRSIRLADLLIEVENDLGFSVHFQRPSERVDPGEVCALLAAILAHGCNLGLYTMEKVAPAIAYRRLKYVSDWRLVEENHRAALAGIVHGISRLDAAGHWGDGTTSASDGQRFAMPHKVVEPAAARDKPSELPASTRTCAVVVWYGGWSWIGCSSSVWRSGVVLSLLSCLADCCSK